MKILSRLKKYYYGMSRVSSGLLAITVEVSVITYAVSILLYVFSSWFASPDLIRDIAFNIGSNASVIAWGGIILSLLSDIIIKYDHLEDEKEENK